MASKIKSAISRITAKPVQFVLNTHFHFDHTGGSLWQGRRAHRGPRQRAPAFEPRPAHQLRQFQFCTTGVAEGGAAGHHGGGDVYFNGSYPFIDVSSGGSAEGVVAAADRVLALATVLQRIKDLRQASKSDDEIRSAKPAADFDARYGNGFIKPELFIQMLLAALPR